MFRMASMLLLLAVFLQSVVESTLNRSPNHGGQSPPGNSQSIFHATVSAQDHETNAFHNGFKKEEQDFLLYVVCSFTRSKPLTKRYEGFMKSRLGCLTGSGYKVLS